MPKARYLGPIVPWEWLVQFLISLIVSFLKLLKLLKLNGCQIVKLDALKVGTFNFAVLIAISNPSEYCLRYGGSLVSGEKALQAGCSVIKVSGGLSVSR